MTQSPLFGDSHGNLDVFSVPKGLDEELIAFLDKQPCRPLESLNEEAAHLGEYIGVYSLYCEGDNPMYEPLVLANRGECHLPIYVGKAVPGGARSGRIKHEELAVAGRSPRGGNSVLKRLDLHRRSVKQAGSLEVQDFKAKIVPMDMDLVAWGESLLLCHLQPIWNQLISGFGNNKPGKRRNEQKLSEWDKLRWGRESMSDLAYSERPDEARYEIEIKQHCEMVSRNLGLS